MFRPSPTPRPLIRKIDEAINTILRIGEFIINLERTQQGKNISPDRLENKLWSLVSPKETLPPEFVENLQEWIKFIIRRRKKVIYWKGLYERDKDSFYNKLAEEKIPFSREEGKVVFGCLGSAIWLPPHNFTERFGAPNDVGGIHFIPESGKTEDAWIVLKTGIKPQLERMIYEHEFLHLITEPMVPAELPAYSTVYKALKRLEAQDSSPEERDETLEKICSYLQNIHFISFPEIIAEAGRVPIGTLLYITLGYIHNFVNRVYIILEGTLSTMEKERVARALSTGLKKSEEYILRLTFLVTLPNKGLFEPRYLKGALIFFGADIRKMERLLSAKIGPTLFRSLSLLQPFFAPPYEKYFTVTPESCGFSPESFSPARSFTQSPLSLFKEKEWLEERGRNTHGPNSIFNLSLLSARELKILALLENIEDLIGSLSKLSGSQIGVIKKLVSENPELQEVLSRTNPLIPQLYLEPLQKLAQRKEELEQKIKELSSLLESPWIGQILQEKLTLYTQEVSIQ